MFGGLLLDRNHLKQMDFFSCFFKFSVFFHDKMCKMTLESENGGFQ